MPATVPEVAAWDERLAAASGPVSAGAIAVAKDTELAELRAAEE